MKQVIIIGGGPAGVSASLYTARAGLETTVVLRGDGSLTKTEKIENYYGFPQAITGVQLMRDGIEGAKQVGVKFIEAEVVGLTYESRHVVETTVGNYEADGIILATGASRAVPPIPGLKELDGRGVSYCAVCDGFFYRGKSVAVLGNGEYALREAQHLLPVAGSVTLLTNGAPAPENVPPELAVNTERIAEVAGGERLEKIDFKNGGELLVSGLFIALGVAGSVALARKIGALTEGNRIVTDETMATNVPGIYAAGDCTGGMLQVAKAVYEGAIAGSELVKYLRNQ